MIALERHTYSPTKYRSRELRHSAVNMASILQREFWNLVDELRDNLDENERVKTVLKICSEGVNTSGNKRDKVERVCS
jgi:hypothetical protein